MKKSVTVALTLAAMAALGLAACKKNTAPPADSSAPASAAVVDSSAPASDAVASSSAVAASAAPASSAP